MGAVAVLTRQGKEVAGSLSLGFQIVKMTAVIAGDSIKPFLGRFQFVRAENLEAWLKAVGQNFLMRKLSLQCSPSADLERVIKDDGKELYISKMVSFFRAVRNEFELNQHFAEDLLDQREVDAVWTWEEDKKCLKTTHVDNNGEDNGRGEGGHTECGHHNEGRRVQKHLEERE